jgi:hypothetical protein
MNALASKWTLVSTPVGNDTGPASSAANQTTRARRQGFSSVTRDHSFLTDFVEGFSWERALESGLDQQYPSVRRAPANENQLDPGTGPALVTQRSFSAVMSSNGWNERKARSGLLSSLRFFFSSRWRCGPESLTRTRVRATDSVPGHHMGSVNGCARKATDSEGVLAEPHPQG